MAITYSSDVAKTLLSTTSTQIINAWIKENPHGVGSVVQVLDGSQNALRQAGTLILSDSKLMNEFCNMINRIADVMVKAAVFENPLKSFKQPASQNGAVVEDSFVELIEPNIYTMDVSAEDFFDVKLPEIKTKLHFLNYQTFYKVPISRPEIELAFLSEAGVMELVSKIMSRIATSAELDEYLAMRYVIARYIADGNAKFVEVGNGATALTKKLRAMANSFAFVSNQYNHEMVKRTAGRETLHLLVDSEIEADQDVDVLASAYNMDKAEWIGRKHLYDHLAPESWEYDRLEKLFPDVGYVRRFTSDEEALLAGIKAIQISDDFLIAIDKLTMMKDFENGQSLLEVFFGHFWKILGVSPFSVCVAYTENAPAITAVTVSGAETVAVGGVYQYTATITADAGADNRVLWEVSGDGYTINQAGTLTVGVGAGASANITATSIADPDQTDTLAVSLSVSA